MVSSGKTCSRVHRLGCHGNRFRVPLSQGQQTLSFYQSCCVKPTRTAGLGEGGRNMAPLLSSLAAVSPQRNQPHVNPKENPPFCPDAQIDASFLYVTNNSHFQDREISASFSCLFLSQIREENTAGGFCTTAMFALSRCRDCKGFISFSWLTLKKYVNAV